MHPKSLDVSDLAINIFARNLGMTGFLRIKKGDWRKETGDRRMETENRRKGNKKSPFGGYF
jgi:hypothetical protein